MIYKNILVVLKNLSFIANITINNQIISNITIVEDEWNGKYILMPPFIDSHTHGGYGVDFSQKIDFDSLNNYFKKLKDEGVGHIIPSFAATDLELIKNNIEFIDKHFSRYVLGYHIEGLLISKEKLGAHNSNYLTTATQKTIDEINKIKTSKKIIFTIDPSNNENMNFIKHYNNQFIFSIGHSNASQLQTTQAIKNGAKKVTHLFNAMSGFSHSKNAGIVNEVLINFKENIDEFNIEIIADGIHVIDDVLTFAFENININNIVVVSDSLAVKGLKDGYYKLGKIDIEKVGDVAYIKDTKTLAGSALTYNKIIDHLFKLNKLSFEDIVKISSGNIWKLFPNISTESEIERLKKAFIIVDKNFNIIH
ncbi:amidohydrolase family protein [Mycoplasma testudineum]|nr:amidohydrolase family protein [Mycoplasma testudineum]OYD26839.1 hypothetical protein CG473_01875 [Mycoplasma testudineum]